jgi:hypothetical protein
MIQSWFFPVRFDSNRIRGALGDTRGNPPLTTGAVVWACSAAARTRRGVARAREIRGIGRPVDEDGNYTSRYSASSDRPESQMERNVG